MGLRVFYPDATSHDISGLKCEPMADQFLDNWSTQGLLAGNQDFFEMVVELRCEAKGQRNSHRLFIGLSRRPRASMTAK
jgi:hypothetical protein